MDLDRARRVEGLMKDPDVKAAWDMVEQSAISSWKQSKTPEGREEQWHRVKAIESLRERLQTFANELKFAPKGDGR